MRAALKTFGLAFRDVWKEMWTILIVHLVFLFGNILLIAGPPVTVALFFYGNRIAHGEMADQSDFFQAIRSFWKPAWRWGFLNLLIFGILLGDYYLTGKIVRDPGTAYFVQGLYITLIAAWLLIQIFALPFLFEQERPLVFQALRNSLVFIRKNPIFVVVLALLLVLSLALGTLAFMLTFAFGGALIAFASNHAVVEHLANQKDFVA
jgi:hypothetical protein